MSTPIENNTTELQKILDAVNSLPNADGSSGVNIQTHTVRVHPIEVGDVNSVDEYGVIYYAKLDGSEITYVDEEFVPSEGIEIRAVANTWCMVSPSVNKITGTGPHDFELCRLDYSIAPDDVISLPFSNQDTSGSQLLAVMMDVEITIINNGPM